MEYRQRVNEYIDASEVALVGPEGQRLGTLSLEDALALAREQSLDLVEIHPSDTLPVCCIADKGQCTQETARAYLNYLLTLNIRREEAFGPLALSFLRDHDFDALGLQPEEHFNLIMATVQVFSVEPKRASAKLDLLNQASALLGQTRYQNPELARQITFEIKKTEKELKVYNEAMRPAAKPQALDQQKLIIQSEVPDYFLDVAQKRAADYFKNKYGLTKQAKSAQNFSGGPRKFEPDNRAVHKEFPGACGPFMHARTSAFHLMLPFDIKISKKTDQPLEGGLRIYYSKMGYSFPLAYENDKLCNYNDGEVVDLTLDDPNLLFFSVSPVKEPKFEFQGTDPSIPGKYAYPQAVLERTGCLGPYLQVVANCKIWFDASVVSILIQGAPDLHEYGLQGGSGLMVRSHASDKLPAYVDNTSEPWMDGLSFNFANIHLGLSPGTETAFVPYNTPLFTVYPVLAQHNYKIEDRRNMPS